MCRCSWPVREYLHEPHESPGACRERARAGRMPGTAASILRLMTALAGYRLREIAMEIAGLRGTC